MTFGHYRYLLLPSLFPLFNSLLKNIYPLLFLSVGLKIGHIHTDRFLFFRKDMLKKLAPPSQPGFFEISYLARFS